MGNFYTNITLYRADRRKALASLQGRNTAVSPTLREFTVVWDDECEGQDMSILEVLTKQLSHDVGCAAWGVLNHDDDVFMYVLFERGEELDRYNSCPGYFDGSGTNPEGGNATLLAT